MCNSVNLLKTTDLDTISGWILSYMNYIPIKLIAFQAVLVVKNCQRRRHKRRFDLIGVKRWGACLEKALQPLPHPGGTPRPQGGCASSFLYWKIHSSFCVFLGLGNMSIFITISLQIFKKFLDDFLIIIFIHMYFSIVGTVKMNWLYLSLSTLFFLKLFTSSFSRHWVCIAAGLHCCRWAFSSCGEQGLPCVQAPGRLTAAASPAAGHRL